MKPQVWRPSLTEKKPRTEFLFDITFEGKAKEENPAKERLVTYKQN